MSPQSKRGSRPRRRPRDRPSAHSYDYRPARELAVTRSARRRRALLIGALLVVVLLMIGLFAAAIPAKGATPSPSPQAGDVRSSAAPGLVGDPLFAVLGVAVVAGASVGITYVYLRLTSDR